MHAMNQFTVIQGSKATHIHRWERKVDLASQALWAFVSRIICWINLLCRIDSSATGKKQKTNPKSGKSPIVAKKSTFRAGVKECLVLDQPKQSTRTLPTEDRIWRSSVDYPSWQLSPTQLLTHFPLAGQGTELGGRGEKPHGLRWDRLTTGKNKTKEK